MKISQTEKGGVKMLRQFFSKRILLTIVSLAVMGAFILNGTTMGYALRPQSTTGDTDRLDDVAKTFGYGFESATGVNLAHDKVFKVKAAVAFTEGRAVNIFGQSAIKTLDDAYEAAAEFLKKSGEVGIGEQEVASKLIDARGFLNDVFSNDFINRVVTEIAKIDEARVQKKAIPFLKMIKEIAAIQDPSLRAQEARKAIVDDTRFIAFLFGAKGSDPYLFSVGNILSKEHRA
ncbi:MAG: hypothetical protein FJZ11_06330, partial [Candidatus Omnitrophica bacterium]|nr:hypothetical protein [Candidatus Omnitrophota bacterium]